jgi:hypothetical protein
VVNETDGIIEQLPEIEFEPFDNTTKNITIRPAKVGHVIIGAISQDIDM